MLSCRKEGSPVEQNKVKQPGSSHEVALSHGVTTDPSLWPPPPGEDDDDDGEEEAEPSSSHNATGMDTMHKSAPLSKSQSPRATPAEVSRSVEEKPEGAREEESQQEGQMKDREQEVASVGGSQTEETLRNTPLPQEQQQQQQTQQTQWAALVEEVASADESLANLLRPLANRKTALMLMEQLLSEDTLLMEEHYKKKQEEGRGSGLEEKQHQEKVEEQEEEVEEKRGQR